jgi:hypothetical protein
MQRVAVALGTAAILAWVAAGCSPAENTPVAQTQPGAAATSNAGPRAGAESGGCRDLPSADDLKKWLRQAPSDGGEAGGLFSGKMEWASVVDRDGRICATAVATDDPASAWPGSQAIAKAKAYTANAYSTDTLPISTARLYTLTQPGHSLWGVGEPNPFSPTCLQAPQDARKTDGQICGDRSRSAAAFRCTRARRGSEASA